MAEALRRLMWLVPLVIVGAVALFALLAQSPKIAQDQELPLFYNRSPTSSQVETASVLASVAAGSPTANARLAELGGASLPHLLPALVHLDVQKQRHVVRALAPVAERMGLLSGQHTDDSLLLFWERYREDHALDFRPLAIGRLVKRLGQRQINLREADLLVVDTYALPTLVDGLGRVNSQHDVERIQRIVPLISHITGKDFAVSPEAEEEEARQVATDIRLFWDYNGAVYTDLDRFGVLAARIEQTEFAVWFRRTFREIIGIDSSPNLLRLQMGGRPTLVLGLLALIGALLLGPTLAGALHVIGLDRAAFQTSVPVTRLTLGLLLGVLLAGALRAPSSASLRGLLALSAGAVLSTYLLQRELADRLDWRSHQVLRRRPPFDRIRAVAGWLAPSVPTYAPIVLAEAALIVTCLEVSSGAEGLGRYTATAFQAGDTRWLMGACLGAAISTGTLQVLADALLGSARFQKGES